MQQQCNQCSAPFEITDEDCAIYEKMSPVIGGKQQLIPPPSLCPQCRQQRRLAFRNDRNYYHNICHLCKKPTISIYSPDKDIPVLCEKCFWGDHWDPLEYGQKYDSGRPFFEQFAALKKRLPRIAIYHSQSENADFTVHSSRNRNCYMCSSTLDCEDVFFTDHFFQSRDCADIFASIRLELCYECNFCDECFGSEFLDHCTNVSDSTLCYDCRGSQHLIGCAFLRNKQHCILNKEASPEKCEETRKRFLTDPAFRADFTRRFIALKLRYPHRSVWLTNTENCSGNELLNCKNAKHCFNVRHLEDGKYAYGAYQATDSYDVSRVCGEMMYECAAIVDLSYGAFCNLTYQCQNLAYCDNCQGTRDSFGCMSLKKHRYCILNTQYTQAEYEALVPKIIEYMKQRREYGEFFPVQLSPFGYNETKAYDWYPLQKKEVLKRGWQWSDYETPLQDVERTIPASKLPPSIDQIPDDILNWAILCEQTNKPFKIIKQELEFYRKRGLPIPHRSPTQRRLDRLNAYNFYTLYDRRCGKCGEEIQTSYQPSRPEVVYCEQCYLETVY